MNQLVQLNQHLEEIQNMGYTVYGISADTPAAHQALQQRENLGFELMSDPTLSFYRQAGIMTGADTGVRRGVVVYDNEGVETFKEVTDDPSTVLLNYLNTGD